MAITFTKINSGKVLVNINGNLYALDPESNIIPTNNIDKISIFYENSKRILIDWNDVTVPAVSSAIDLTQKLTSFYFTEIQSENSGATGNTIAIFNTAKFKAVNTNTIYVLKAIKPNPIYPSININIIDCSISSTAKIGLLMLIKNPAISSALTYTDISKFKEATGTGETITAGTGTVIGAMSVGKGISNLSEVINKGTSGKITPDNEFVLAILPFEGNKDFSGVINLNEN